MAATRGDAGAPVDVSVVIPAFNAEGTLAAQLEALVGQVTSRSFEVLVADNGSTDGTAALVTHFAARHPSVRLVDASQVRGASAARNAGAAEAKGRALLFCDADDVAGPAWIDEMARVLDEHDAVGGVLDAEFLNGDNRASVTWHASGYVRFGFWPEFAGAPTSNLGVLRDAFRGVQGFDVHLPAGEDIDLCWRIQLRGGTMGQAERAVMHVRRRDGLRQVARQAYVWGSGERLLQDKYADIIAAAARATKIPMAGAVGTENPAAPDPATRAGHRLRRLLKVRHLGDFADPVWRAFNAAGRRWARLPANLERLTPEYRQP
jgi:glycosyltransferase involved in cell wall biosynthesis